MARIPKSYRFHQQTVNHLQDIEHHTGTNQTAIIEQAIAVYYSLLRHGTIPIDSPHNHPQPARPTPVRPTPTAPQPPARTTPQPTGNQQKQPTSNPAGTQHTQQPNQIALHQHTAHGHTYTFTFPTQNIPQLGSQPCPCGSGEIFARCHKKDFQKAIKAGLTRHG